MKKIVSTMIIFAIILLQTISLAYNTEEYQIEVPENFQEVVENVFSDELGNSVNVQIISLAEGEQFEYSEAYLEMVVNSVLGNIDQYKAEAKEQLKVQYDGVLTEEQIDEYLSTFKYNEFELKEVTTFTKNNYPCLHYISNLTMGDANTYSETYQVVSDSKIYTVTISSTDKAFFEDESVKGMINSFTINNYVELQNEEVMESVEKQANIGNIIMYVGLVLIAVGIVIIISVVIKKKNK